jgi:hypothetical protein
MFSKFALKLLAGAVATAIAGTAMANTSLNATTSGDLFLNIEDVTNNTSYLFDTGISQASFNGSGSYQFNLSGDTNLTGFLNSKDTFDYSVVSAVNTPSASIDITGNATSTPTNTSAFNNTQAQTAISLFLQNANLQTSTSNTSVVLATGSDWGQGTSEGIASRRVYNISIAPYGDNTALNTPLAFYNVTGSDATTFASDWNFSTSNDTLTYGAPVPLPTPVLLLLSGLGMMGAVARRAKSVA